MDRLPKLTGHNLGLLTALINYLAVLLEYNDYSNLHGRVYSRQ